MSLISTKDQLKVYLKDVNDLHKKLNQNIEELKEYKDEDIVVHNPGQLKGSFKNWKTHLNALKKFMKADKPNQQWFSANGLGERPQRDQYQKSVVDSGKTLLSLQAAAARADEKSESEEESEEETKEETPKIVEIQPSEPVPVRASPEEAKFVSDQLNEYLIRVPADDNSDAVYWAKASLKNLNDSPNPLLSTMKTANKDLNALIEYSSNQKLTETVPPLVPIPPVTSSFKPRRTINFGHDIGSGTPGGAAIYESLVQVPVPIGISSEAKNEPVSNNVPEFEAIPSPGYDSMEVSNQNLDTTNDEPYSPPPEYSASQADDLDTHLIETIEQLNNDIIRKNSQIDELLRAQQSRENGDEVTIQRLQTQINELTESNIELSNLTQSVTSSLEQKQSEMTELSDRLFSTGEQAKELNTAYEQSQQEIAKLNQTIKTMQQNLDNLAVESKMEIELLETEKQQLQKQYEDEILKRIIPDPTGQMSELKEREKRLSQTITTLQTEITQLTAQVNEKTRLNKQQKETIQKHQTQISELQQSVKDRDETISVLNVSASSLVSEHKDEMNKAQEKYREQLLKLQQSLHPPNNVTITVDNKVHEQTVQELSKLQTKYDALTTQTAAIQKKNTEWKERIKLELLEKSRIKSQLETLTSIHDSCSLKDVRIHSLERQVSNMNEQKYESESTQIQANLNLLKQNAVNAMNGSSNSKTTSNTPSSGSSFVSSDLLRPTKPVLPHVELHPALKRLVLSMQ